MLKEQLLLILASGLLWLTGMHQLSLVSVFQMILPCTTMYEHVICIVLHHAAALPCPATCLISAAGPLTGHHVCSHAWDAGSSAGDDVGEAAALVDQHPHW
jgi:hypothetical protein